MDLSEMYLAKADPVEVGLVEVELAEAGLVVSLLVKAEEQV